LPPNANAHAINRNILNCSGNRFTVRTEYSALPRQPKLPWRGLPKFDPSAELLDSFMT
jgi:hypothetical protein